MNAQDTLAGVGPGDVLAGKYRVERVLGAGGMGVVVAAHHLQLDERVALKFLLPDALQNPEAVARFVREARAAVRIKGEHVARVSDVGQLDNGAPYIVMEYLEGSDLSIWLKQRGPMPAEQAVDFVLQACEAIADAHALGIVHRDLKPANLFCVQRSDGQLSIKVLDFGISKVTAPGPGGDMTRTNALVGSPFYMSPEQMQSSKNVDARTDIWSLGIILFELVAGRRPFDAEAVTELAIKVAMEPAPPLRALRTDAPAGLEHAIAVCLAKDRNDRFRTVGDLAIALKDLGSRRAMASVERIVGTLQQAGLASEPSAPSGPPRASLATETQRIASTSASWGQTGPTHAPPRRHVAAWGAIGAAAVLSILAASALSVLWKRPPPTVAAAVAFPAPPTATVEASDPAPSVQPAPSPAESPDVPPVVASSAPSVAVARPVALPPTTRPTAAQPKPPSAPSPTPSTGPAGAKPSCTPPFFFDSAGHKQYKPECI